MSGAIFGVQPNSKAATKIFQKLGECSIMPPDQLQRNVKLLISKNHLDEAERLMLKTANKYYWFALYFFGLIPARDRLYTPGHKQQSVKSRAVVPEAVMRQLFTLSRRAEALIDAGHDEHSQELQQVNRAAEALMKGYSQLSKADWSLGVAEYMKTHELEIALYDFTYAIAPQSPEAPNAATIGVMDSSSATMPTREELRSFNQRVSESGRIARQASSSDTPTKEELRAFNRRVSGRAPIGGDK